MYPFHQPLEHSGCILQSKGHNLELVKSLVGDERCLLTGGRVYWHLPVSRSEIEGREILGPPKLIQEFIHSGEVEMCQPW